MNKDSCSFSISMMGKVNIRLGDRTEEYGEEVIFRNAMANQ